MAGPVDSRRRPRRLNLCLLLWWCLAAPGACQVGTIETPDAEFASNDLPAAENDQATLENDLTPPDNDPGALENDPGSPPEELTVGENEPFWADEGASPEQDSVKDQGASDSDAENCQTKGCPEGQWCDNQSCVACNTDDHCGTLCIDCLGQARNKKCIQNQCGCTGMEHCAVGESCVASACCQPSTAPISISASANPVCIGQSAVLTPEGGTMGTGASYQWFAGSCGSTVIATGTTYTASPISTTQYFVRRTGGACNVTTSCASIQLVAGYTDSWCFRGSLYGYDACGQRSANPTATCQAWQTCRYDTCAPQSDEFVHAVGRKFMVHDGTYKEFFPSGINYQPVYNSKIVYIDSWAEDAHYRPDIVEDELIGLKNMGINMISIAITKSVWDPWSLDMCENLNDIFTLANKHSLRVNLAIGPPYGPIIQAENLGENMQNCDTGSIASNPTIFAYDIFWEPYFINPNPGGIEFFYTHYNGPWEQWLKERYGSLAHADSLFGESHDLPSLEADRANWEAELCDKSQPHMKIAAVRRFLEDYTSQRFLVAQKSLHVIDPNHLIGMRSGYGNIVGPEVGGIDYGLAACHLIFMDQRSGIKHLDFSSTEGYSLNPPDKVMNRGGLINAYMDVGKPIYWAEWGADSIVLPTPPTPPPYPPNYGNLITQSDFYHEFWSMLQAKGANGSAAWYFVGYRPQNAADPVTTHNDWGVIYDYAYDPTAFDQTLAPMRAGFVGMYSPSSVNYGIYVFQDGISGTYYSCPGGMTAYGFFRPQDNQQGQGVVAVGAEGISIENGWLMICGVDNAVRLKIFGTSFDPNKTDYGCASGNLIGSFRTSAATVDLTNYTQPAWVGICSTNANVQFKRAYHVLSNTWYNNPPGTVGRGYFWPSTQEVFKPAADVFQNFVSNTNRNYNKWVTVDRDKYAGAWVSFIEAENAYTTASADGSLVGVQTPCRNTTSLDTQNCVGYGNVLYSTYKPCPIRCLDAEWNKVEILGKNGMWQAVQKNGTVVVSALQPVQARFSAGNVGEGRWLSQADAGGPTGSVRYGCKDSESSDTSTCEIPIPSSVDSLKDAESDPASIFSSTPAGNRVVIFQMLSKDRAWFGEQWKITLQGE